MVSSTVGLVNEKLESGEGVVDFWRVAEPNSVQLESQREGRVRELASIARNVSTHCASVSIALEVARFGSCPESGDGVVKLVEWTKEFLISRDSRAQ